MHRRSFLSTLLASGALYASGAGVYPRAHAGPLTITGQRHLVSVLLSGGPDFRHLFPPAFSTQTDSFAHHYWNATAASHGLPQNTAMLAARWQNDYDHINDSDLEFGILKSCSWLRSMWDAGNVAIVNNVLTTSSRNHPLAVLIAEQGNRSSTANDFHRPGWGGLLADAADRNVLSLTQTPRKFCYGASGNTINGRSDQRLISAASTREITLFGGDPDQPPLGNRSSITRSVASYYQAKRDGFMAAQATARFADHERKLRLFGEPIDDRLASIPIPDDIKRLYDPEGIPLYNVGFGLQIRNLYDSLACADILEMGLAALEYKGWDTHRLQKESIEPRLYDLFGEGQALASLYRNLPSEISDQLVIVLNGEFGRQIRANGDGGTDHGEGSTTLIIGASVNGGIYGDMYPIEEIDELNNPGPQITGKTAIERVYTSLGQWLSADNSVSPFAGAEQSPLEAGVDLSNLF